MQKRLLTLIRVIFLVLISALGGTNAGAEPTRPRTLQGARLELTQTIARHLLAVQHEERAAAEQAPLSSLFRELEGLREAIRPKSLLPSGNGIDEKGRKRSRARASGDSAKAVGAARARERGEVRNRSARVRQAARDLETKIETLPTPRLRAAARQAVKRATLLAGEADAAVDLSPVERRAKKKALYQRLRQRPRQPVADTPELTNEAPNFTTITRHRRFWATAQ